MKITFDHMTQIDKNTQRTNHGAEIRRTTETVGGYVNVAFDGKERAGFGTRAISGNKNTVPEVTDSVDAQVQNMRNQMTVMSHTMSDEDFARLQKEGYDLSEYSPEEAVTILDKIKAELLKSGEYVAGFTDRMDMETLVAAVGSETLAASLAESFVKQDIPFDKQNVEQVLWALNIAKQMKEPTDSSLFYMAVNGMHATLTDFYRAGASGACLEQVQTTGYFAADSSGYVTKNVDTPAGRLPNIEPEINKLLEKLAIPQEESVKELASWMVEKGLEVDSDNLIRMKEIFSVQFPLDESRVIQTAASAIAEGRPAGEGNLSKPVSYYQKAVQLFETYQGEAALSLVQDRRQLEEIRLQMTVETNIRLLKSSFAFETAPIEETIEALKQAEQELAMQYFPKEETAVENYRLLRAAGQCIKELSHLPLTQVGRWAERLEAGTLAEFHAEGLILADTYRKAGERYETIWTSPRADLGDSVKKAFANVDQILKDLNYEATEENRKALRALGYNRMELTAEHIEKVKTAMESVEKVIRQMTPQATLKMIRDGMNPLDCTLPELNTYFEELPEGFTTTADKYSKFLFQLSQQGEITEQEREAFIGCFRLLNQLEKSDGAAVGALVNTGAELNFRNLLSALRSGKFKSMDVRVNDTVGALTEETVMKFSISEQIEQAFVKNQAAQTREMLSQAAQTSKAAYQTLERGQLPPTAQNLVAAQILEQHGGMLPEKLYLSESDERKKKEIWKKLQTKEEFSNQYEEMLTEDIRTMEEDVLQTSDDIVDLRQQRILYKQLHIMQKLALQEEFYFPMEIAGEVTGVHLQFVSSETEQGMIRLSLDSREGDRLCGQIKVTDKGVEGYFVGNNRETVMKLKNSSDIISSSIRKEWMFCEIEYVYSETNDIPMDWTRRSSEVSVSNEQLYDLAKNFLQAVKGMGEA